VLYPPTLQHMHWRQVRRDERRHCAITLRQSDTVMKQAGQLNLAAPPPVWSYPVSEYIRFRRNTMWGCPSFGQAPEPCFLGDTAWLSWFWHRSVQSHLWLFLIICSHHLIHRAPVSCIWCAVTIQCLVIIVGRLQGKVASREVVPK